VSKERVQQDVQQIVEIIIIVIKKDINRKKKEPLDPYVALYFDSSLCRSWIIGTEGKICEG